MKIINTPARIDKWEEGGNTVVSVRDKERTLAIIPSQLDNSEETIAGIIVGAINSHVKRNP